MVSNYGYISSFKKLTKFWPKDKLHVQAWGMVQSNFHQSLAPAPGF